MAEKRKRARGPQSEPLGDDFFELFFKECKQTEPTVAPCAAANTATEDDTATPAVVPSGRTSPPTQPKIRRSPYGAAASAPPAQVQSITKGNVFAPSVGLFRAPSGQEQGTSQILFLRVDANDTMRATYTVPNYVLPSVDCNTSLLSFTPTVCVTQSQIFNSSDHTWLDAFGPLLWFVRVIDSNSSEQLGVSRQRRADIGQIGQPEVVKGTSSHVAENAALVLIYIDHYI
jgi:hypothetical protein